MHSLGKLAAVGIFLSLSLALGAAKADPIASRGALDAANAGSAETTLGDLAADAARAAAGADFAIVAADELKPVALPAAALQSEQLAGALRASQDATDTIVVLKLSGTQLRAAMERGVSRAPGSYPGFLQVSGFRVAYDPNKPQGSRVLTMVRPDGSPLQMGQSYTVATTRLLADGALGYFEVWTKDAVARNTGVSFAKSVDDYAHAHQPLSYRVEGRVASK